MGGKTKETSFFISLLLLAKSMADNFREKAKAGGIYLSFANSSGKIVLKINSGEICPAKIKEVNRIAKSATITRPVEHVYPVIHKGKRTKGFFGMISLSLFGADYGLGFFCHGLSKKECEDLIHKMLKDSEEA